MTQTISPSEYVRGDVVVGALISQGYYGLVYAGHMGTTPVVLKTLNDQNIQQTEEELRVNSLS